MTSISLLLPMCMAGVAYSRKLSSSIRNFTQSLSLAVLQAAASGDEDETHDLDDEHAGFRRNGFNQTLRSISTSHWLTDVFGFWGGFGLGAVSGVWLGIRLAQPWYRWLWPAAWPSFRSKLPLSASCTPQPYAAQPYPAAQQNDHVQFQQHHLKQPIMQHYPQPVGNGYDSSNMMQQSWPLPPIYPRRPALGHFDDMSERGNYHQPMQQSSSTSAGLTQQHPMVF